MTDQIQITKTNPGVINSSEIKYPTEIVYLPSKGNVYEETSPLSSGQVEIKMMTAKEEDILTNPNFLKKGIAIDKLLQSLLVNKSINLDEMVVGDKNALIFAVRRLAYGDIYGPIEIKCPSCSEKNSVKIDLSKFEDKEIDENSVDKIGTNVFKFTLPFSKLEITFKLLNGFDEKNIEEESKRIQKISYSELTTRLKYMILSVHGNSDKKFIREFVDNHMVSRDSLAFRKHLKQISPDIDSSFEFTCSECDHKERSGVPMTVQFFWPDTTV